MNTVRTEFLQGTLDLLLLKIVAQGPIHGYGIAQKLLVLSRETLLVQQGSLYPALHRLERKGFVNAEWKESESGRMAKLYSITNAGARQLKQELANWKLYTEAMAWILEA
jgi:transcriptional regulator